MSSDSNRKSSRTGWQFTRINNGTTVTCVGRPPKRLTKKINQVASGIATYKPRRLAQIEIKQNRIEFITNVNPNANQDDITHALDGLESEITAVATQIATSLPPSQPARRSKRKQRRHPGKRATLKRRPARRLAGSLC